MDNIIEVTNYDYDHRHMFKPSQGQYDMTNRNEWLARQIRRFYSEEEVQQVFTNRRSDITDDGVMKYFFKGNQPLHFIPEDHHTERAINWTFEKFKPNRPLNPISFPDLRYYPTTLSVSAEAPWTTTDFRFTPTGRNIDHESDQPKLSQFVDRLPIGTRMPIKAYLQQKQRMGLIDDDRAKFHNLYNEIFVHNRTLVHQISTLHPRFWINKVVPKPYYWNTLHARSHVVAQDEPDKVRAVFGATKLLLQVELMFIWPLQASYLNTGAGQMLWGREIIRGGWKRMFNELHKNGPPNTVISADWSEFDSRLLHQLMRIVHHRIWRKYYDFSHYEPTSFYPESSPKDPRKLDRLWKWMTEAILNTPILLPNGRLYRWLFNGFGSGYQQTQLMDTFCNSIMIITCLSALGVNVDAREFWAKFQGDDSLFAFFEIMFRIYGPHFKVMFAETAKYYFNAKLSVKKTHISDRVTGISVLSYFNSFGIPWRTDEDLLRHLFFPERSQNFPKLAASAMGLAYANCGHSDRFHALCEMIWDKLVVKKEIKPQWAGLRWMERAGYIETLKMFEGAHFPTRLYLLSMVYEHTPRSDSENQRQWPDRPGPKGRFYFLNSI